MAFYGKSYNFPMRNMKCLFIIYTFKFNCFSQFTVIEKSSFWWSYLEHKNFQHLESVRLQRMTNSHAGITKIRLQHWQERKQRAFPKQQVWGAKEMRPAECKYWKGAISASWFDSNREEQKFFVTSSTPTSKPNPLSYPASPTPGLSGKLFPESIQLRYYCPGKADWQNRMGLAQLFHSRENTLLFDLMILLLPPTTSYWRQQPKYEYLGLACISIPNFKGRNTTH